MNDYVLELPRVEREELGSVWGDWTVTFQGRVWSFSSWAVALEFVEDGGHRTSKAGI